METTKVICGACGHTEERTDIKSDEVYFPYRWVYITGQNTPLACTNCDDKGDMVVFGKNYVAGANGFNLLHLPEVIENNRICLEREDKEKYNSLVNTWLRAFQVTLKTQKNHKARLKELETWDTSNKNMVERQAKIDALKILIKK